MIGANHNGQNFIRRLTEITEANLNNELFGPDNLASQMGYSHSTLHRKIKNATGKTISQFIREVRLNKAKELLKDRNLTVSEVAWKVGFGSPSYFTKCYHEHYGFAPGETKNHIEDENQHKENKPRSAITQNKWLAASAFLSLILVVILAFHDRFTFNKSSTVEKTIAVLPFKNDSPDSTNSYFINGLMESILNNLSSIEDLGVRSRTSVEKYRGSGKSLIKIAGELGVNYIVEGSGQRYGDEILLNIQLIEANNDRHLFSEQYRKKIIDAKDLFNLQSEIALSVASRVNAEITAEEEKHIEEMPTENLAAYNFYLQGYEYLMLARKKPLWQFYEECLKSNQLLREAIKLDSTFSDAYRHLAHNYINNLVFFSKDIYQVEQFLDTGLVLINKALKYDENNWGALAIKSQYLLQKGKFTEARKTLEELPENWSETHNMYETDFNIWYGLDDYYNAIKSFYSYARIKSDEIHPYMIFKIATCLTDMGYPKPGKKLLNEFINQYNDSLGYYSTMALIELYSGDFTSSIEFGNSAINIDSTNLTAILVLLIDYIYQRDQTEIKKYLGKLETLKSNNFLWVNLDLYAGFACLETGMKNKADEYLNRSIKTQKAAIELNLNTPASQYYEAHLYLAMIYAALGNQEESMKYLKRVKYRKIIPKTFLIQLQHWPGTENLKDIPEFIEIIDELNEKHQKEHLRVGELLREMGEI